MPQVLSDTRLIFVTKALSTHRTQWRAGISLHVDSGLTLDDLTKLVAADRWRLGDQYRLHAGRMLRLSTPPHRSIISRYYYAMYHAMRACAYVFHDGDDYEEHSKLPLNVPADMPTSAVWQTKLKDARLLRNKADYDPYPKHERSWSASASQIRIDATDLVAAAKAYLLGKGCTL